MTRMYTYLDILMHAYVHTHSLLPTYPHATAPRAAPVVPYQPHLPHAGAPAAALPPLPALLRIQQPNAVADCHAAHEQTRSKVSTPHRQAHSEVATRPRAPARGPHVRETLARDVCSMRVRVCVVVCICSAPHTLRGRQAWPTCLECSHIASYRCMCGRAYILINAYEL